MASVAIDRVQKQYGAASVLHGVSADIEDGEFVTLVGPSGCGKSTLLRMLAGLEDISGGEIRIDGRVVNDVAPKERDIAMVFQSYALYPHMTVRENMGFALKLQGRDKATINKLVSEAAGILALEPLLERLPKQLSGGQRQRVAMGRAIVRHPKVFLFDEPLSNLDAKLRVTMRSEIKELHQRLGTTIVYVTHDQIEAMTMADKIVVMRAGRIEQIGKPLDLYDRPDNTFVAAFIGSPSMNLFEGGISDGSFRIGGGVSLPLPPQFSHSAARTYGIRPEDLDIAETGIPATVLTVEPTGAETHLSVRVGTQTATIVLHRRVDIKPDQQIHLAPKSEKIHLFSAEGNRIG
ncbi:sn-glycerol-3-phosphate ABC transporter ATP-binding protein UgpC (plasmid) [Rhizobium leguminosarum]|uniref:ATP-binding component of ABC transporter n=1 Tax=Rhizobium johnstonii (strain DSM 114642 / LMG 32736 / 3841) TaxID=216596 RepID=Q1M3Q5_RHIJ3|nr:MULTISPECIES: sn-glycerol-3-phosphate ABC transporter ATP-binding protein UgpC [Rhizobium]MBB4506611.1 multiple sugar transport system ATP-binding protein [Rhizobium leguminosarum]NEI93717.1 sn-glycerol-3-phosphate ABC transporter ATP-binding protein UgpC [Rhizobium leguminosarum]NEJ80008.1 sn-glycerol-3-phosphate ABC transporter ATP-binding protein UgpC [Rhizobium leguminosarum]TBF27759.1 sn-glycerol-3-phosphate ABC transporter ATP-binding protein UgpC [Rhizobium leguminosarum]TBF46848.1 s